jgi:hypothetical protein
MLQAESMTPDARLLALPWYRQVPPRLLALFWLKAIGTTVFMTVFFTAYLHLLKNPASVVTEMPLTGVDRWLAFNPSSLPVYLSLWLYTSLPPALMIEWRDLVRYGASIGAVCLLGLLFFYWFPTAVPPAMVDWSIYPGFDFLKKIDTAGNACPSLHVAAAAFSGVWLHRQLGAMGAGRVVLLVNAGWCVAILYSTLATKQHVFLDLLAGLALGLVGVWLALRWIAPPARPAVLAARA